MHQIQLQRHDPPTNIDLAGAGKQARDFHPFGEDGLTFGDVFDLINPLQHIPLLGGLYRKLTGDTIDPAMRIAGGALFGGPIGAAVATVAVAVGKVRNDLVPSTSQPQTEQPYAMPIKQAAMVAKPRRSIIETAAIDRPNHSNTVDRDIRTKILGLRHDPGRTNPRGSWVLAHAYGSNAETLLERNAFHREGRVDVAV